MECKPYKLPRDLTNMLWIGHELKVDFTAIDPENNTKENLPIWQHIGANNALLELSSKREAKCLCHKHRTRTVQEMNIVAGMENAAHKPPLLLSYWAILSLLSHLTWIQSLLRYLIWI
jgi:hypothetical protein